LKWEKVELVPIPYRAEEWRAVSGGFRLKIVKTGNWPGHKYSVHLRYGLYEHYLGNEPNLEKAQALAATGKLKPERNVSTPAAAAPEIQTKQDSAEPPRNRGRTRLQYREGPPPISSTTKIVILVSGNKCDVNSKRYKTYELVKTCATAGEFFEKGGPRSELGVFWKRKEIDLVND
jgi:hypothetical protein